MNLPLGCENRPVSYTKEMVSPTRDIFTISGGTAVERHTEGENIRENCQGAIGYAYVDDVRNEILYLHISY